MLSFRRERIAVLLLLIVGSWAARQFPFPFPKGRGVRYFGGSLCCFTSAGATYKMRKVKTGESPLMGLRKIVAKEGKVWMLWLMRTAGVAAFVFVLPIEADITTLVKVGIVAAVMCAIYIQTFVIPNTGLNLITRVFLEADGCDKNRHLSVCGSSGRMISDICFIALTTIAVSRFLNSKK
jgi:hypothetical protein